MTVPATVDRLDSSAIALILDALAAYAASWRADAEVRATGPDVDHALAVAMEAEGLALRIASLFAVGRRMGMHSVR
ncbi:hypothetical protein AOT83_26260 [Mycobacteroides sp. H001]|uniref:hypothetical protein n=1 Tax=Mycobacteroides TaxID=670516 RepID=UPI000712D929|nr:MULTISPECIES: hypothetical protein [Mycobacteroides]KRQ20029.1 hypothetical protein AOT86_24095 [Mycobacteroides sp. H072]KRQ29761.1 hypothetical protein AOT84_26135 [Mycobacteroides sp. H002]KRQ48368.1 hypothetical protein AOT85_18895 [Mycobacteroides sp. H054]KRQ65131.1 hypothetical protein AOT83_26260 [Mycobacteroides sp. H001]OHU43668.1 hypothetical protein BKG79_07240 [Mycobacteroides chelonae]